VIKGTSVEPKIFQKRTLSENFQILNSFYNHAEKAIEALEDISTVLSDYPEVLRSIKTFSERILRIRENYISLLEKIRDIGKVQATLHVRDEISYCAFCGERGETYPYESFNLCKECLTFIRERNIPRELIREKMRLTHEEIKLLKYIREKNPITKLDLLHEAITNADKWTAYERLLRKGYVKEVIKKFPPLIILTESGRRLAEIC
jgi:hypothetical protein